MKTHYDLIGVKKDATQDEIRKAYLSLAKQLHPDKTGGDKESESKLKEINAAYDVLKDKNKRATYDQSLNPKAFHPGSSGFGPMMHDLFVKKRGKFAPQELRVVVPITLEEAYTGCRKEVVYQNPVKCEICNGTGGEDYEVCRTCAGSGMIHSMSGMAQISRTCNSCGGRGGRILKPCKACKERGYTSEEKTISLDIPKCADSGMASIIPDAGIFGGNLIAIIQIKPHEKFERNDLDIIAAERIPLTTALLGGEITVQTIGGSAKVKISPGIEIGQVLRLKGQGMSDKGDHLIVLDVILPKNLSEKAKGLVMELEKEIL